jgi:cytochrome bd-type quinol oxidase subunit 2
MKRILSYLGLLMLAVVPVVSFAQFGPVDSFIGDLTQFINSTLIPIIIAIAFFVFLYGAIKFFFWNTGDEYDDNKKKGKQLMIYAVAGFVLIVSIWGIVKLVSDGLNLNQKVLNNQPEVPTIR